RIHRRAPTMRLSAAPLATLAHAPKARLARRRSELEDENDADARRDESQTSPTRLAQAPRRGGATAPARARGGEMADEPRDPRRARARARPAPAAPACRHHARVPRGSVDGGLRPRRGDRR